LSEPWLDPALRESCRGQLARELMLRLVMHDVRNPLTPIVGALEMMEMGGVEIPEYLTRSVQRLSGCLQAYSEFSWTRRADVPPGAAINAVLGDIVVGGHHPLPLSPMRLVSALELARPLSVDIRPDPSHGWRVSVMGLSKAAVALAMAPRFEELSGRFHDPDPLAGAALLRAVAREAGGQLGRVDGGTFPTTGLVMLLPG